MDNKKAVAAAIAAVISASGAAIDATFDNPADILQDTSIQPKVAYADPTINPDDDTIQDEKKEAQTVKGTFRGWILSLPIGVRALFIVPQWFIGNVIVAGGQFLFAGLSPLFNALLTFAIMAAVIIGIGLIMMSNNGCDIEKDRRAGRRTLPSLLGRARTLKLYRFLTGVWIFLLVAVPALLAGAEGGIAAALLLLLLARGPFRRVLTLRLLPEQRVLQMKSIAAANLTGNGALVLSLLLAAAKEGLHV